MSKEIYRKLFHLLGGLYAAGFILLPRTLFIKILVAIFIGEAIIEIGRLMHPRVNRLVESIFGPILRGREKGKLTGVFWMILGALSVSLLVSSPTVAAGIMLYVVFGDGIASLAGKSLGGPHWPSLDKRISGSLACFIACVVVGFILVKPVFGWNGVLLGAAVATIVEIGFLRLDDNFMIPFVSSLAFVIAYGFTPPF